MLYSIGSTRTLTKLLPCFLILGMCTFSGPILTAETQAPIRPSVELSEENPFAENYIILQVSDNDPVKFSTVLDIANNLIKHYKSPDMVDIEIISFAAGVPMTFNTKSNSNISRIKSLMANGVRFYVCLNTIDTIERKTKKRPDILDGVIGVQTGVAFMINEVKKGYLLVHP